MEPEVTEMPDSDFEVEGSDAQEPIETKPEASKAEPEPDPKPDPKPEPEPDDLEPEPEKAAAEAEPEPEKKPDNPRYKAEARVKEATRRVAEEREARLTAEARVAELEAKAAVPEPADEKPVPEQFTTYEEYIDAFTDWKTDKRIAQFQEKERQQAAVAEQARTTVDRMASYRERMAVAVKADPELWARVDPEIRDVRPTFMLAPNERPGPENDVAQAVFESEHSMELMLHLSAHPEEMVRLAGLPDSFSVARAMGALEAKITADPPPRLVPVPAEEAPASKAKPPVKPLGGSAQRSEEDVTDDMGFDEHMRIMTAKDRRAERGR